MPKAALQQVANIIDSSSPHMRRSPSKNIIDSKQTPNEQLSQDMLKNKLSTCLYGLKQISNHLKNTQIEDNMHRHLQDKVIEQQIVNSNKVFPLNRRRQQQSRLPTILQSRSNPHLTRIFNPSKLNNIIPNNNTSASNNRSFQLLNSSSQSSFNCLHEKSYSQSSFKINHSSMELINMSNMSKTAQLTSFITNKDNFNSKERYMQGQTSYLSKTGTSFINDLSIKRQFNKSKSPQLNKSVSEKQKSINKNKKPYKIHPKQTKHLYQTGTGKALAKQHKYFSNTDPTLDPSQITKLGLYQSSNRFRKQFIHKDMMSMSPTVEKKFIQQITTCKQNQLFLTRPKQIQPIQMEQFLKEEFAMISDVRDNVNVKKDRQNSLKKERQNSIKKDKQNLLNIEKTTQVLDNNSSSIQSMRQHTSTTTKQQLLKYQNQSQQQFCCQQQQQDEQTITKQNQLSNICFLQIKNHLLVKNQPYLIFKKQHIHIWQEISTLINQLIKFLKQNKITHWKFKANNLLSYYSGKKLSIKDIEKILKLKHKQLPNNKSSPIENIIHILKAKRFTQSIINKRQKHLTLMRWVVDRMKGHTLINHQTQYKIQKAHQLHQQLLKGDYQWDVQIYISSFSQTQFVRNTTQYMESFQNMFTHMWRQSSKQMVLVLPTVNAQLLQVYQQKLKIKRAITIVCPQVHQLFPQNISLAGCLLFSYQALNKIKRLIEGKKAVIIPGKFCQQPKYQLLISEYLRTPLMASLRPKKTLQAQKILFQQAQLPVFTFTYIQSKSDINIIIIKFAQLIYEHKQTTQWVFKINGQFSGRGLAMFSTKSSKVLRSILSSCKDTTKPLQEYLKRNLQLKLKINFQNSLFMLGDYLERLAERGGIIQEQKEAVESYEVSFFIENKLNSYIISCYKCFSTNHSNKAYIYQPVPNGHISQYLLKLKSVLAVDEYLGYVSVNMIVSDKQVYGIEIKPYLTHLCSVQPFIKAIESRRQLKLNLQLQQKPPSKQLNTQTLRNDFTTNRQKPKDINNNYAKKQTNSNKKYQTYQNQSILLKNISITELQSQRHSLSEFNYLFIPNIILTDVPLTKKATFIQSLVLQTWTKNKFNIMDNNLVLYLSNGLSLSVLIVGRQITKMKKIGIDTVRMLSEKVSALKIYCGKNQPRDVFQFGDIIKALTQIKC